MFLCIYGVGQLTLCLLGVVPLPLDPIDVLHHHILVELLGEVFRGLALVIPGTEHVHGVHTRTD